MKKRVTTNESLFSGKKPLLISHRGYTPLSPENSLASFKEAAKRKYWAIETDVHETADGVPVCCHNSSLLKMYGASVKIEESTYAELSGIYIVNGSNSDKYSREELRLPLLDEYLEICKKNNCVPFIETKGNVVGKTLKAVEKFNLTDRAVLSSISFEHILEARELSDIFVHHIFSTVDRMLIISELGNGGVSYNYPILDEVPDGLIEQAHAAGVKVCLRAADSRETLNRMIAMKLDYMPTNCMTPE